MKLKNTFFVLFIAFTTIAMKANNLPIPVTVNESITVTLFFPSAIEKVIEPAPHYKFDYEPNATMATLVARKGATSNLTVITKDGSIFSFLLQYDNEVNNFTYVLAADQAIGTLKGSSAVAVSSNTNEDVVDHNEEPNNKKPVVEAGSNEPLTRTTSKEKRNVNKKTPAKEEIYDSEEDETPENTGSSLYNSDRESYYQIFCENSYLKKSRFKKSSNTINLIGLHLNNIIKDHNDLHFVMEIKNDSWTDFKVKSLKFFIKSLKGNHEIEMKELFVYNLQESIAAHSANNLVFICKDFALGKGQNIYVLLKEEEGRERSVMLSLNAEQIKPGK